MENYKALLTRLFGISILSWYIWFRFIRERLPKVIPFELSEIRFILLCCICLVFIYIISLYVYPRKPNEYILKVKDFIFESLRDIDNRLKTNNIIENIIDIYVLKTVIRIKDLNYMYVVIIIDIIPRIILISILLLDIFYFQYINIFYKAILIAFIPIIGEYLKYSLYSLYLFYLLRLEDYCKGYICSEMDKDFPRYSSNIAAIDILEYEFDVIEPDTFITRYCYSIIYHNKIYQGKPLFINKYQFDLSKDTFLEEKRHHFYILLDNLSNKTLFLALCYYKWKVASEKIVFKYIKIIIYCLYLICWSYILYISMHTLTDLPFLKTVVDTTEPFSGLFIKNDYSYFELWNKY